LKFDFNTIQDFDRHINSSIPRYEDIYKCIDGINEYFIKKNSKIYDLGCSTGKLLKDIQEKNKDKNLNLIGIDKAKNLLSQSIENCLFIEKDLLSDDCYIENADIVYSLFTLCFIDQKYRGKVINKVFNGLNNGGIFICCEKIYSSNSRIQDIFTFLYYDYKKQFFNEKEIMDKERDLRELQGCQSEEENIEMFRNSGFKKVDTFWKYWNFQGYICVK
jgi:tRNA (cmo5U34)-methyltransferase